VAYSKSAFVAEQKFSWLSFMAAVISRTEYEDDGHRGNNDDRSVRAFAVKPRAFGRAARADAHTVQNVLI
jgi:hypothetical protein